MTRRLAAILAADVVGYSALMAEDENSTLEALRRMRAEVFNPAVAGHRGKIVKNMGDGWLVEFASAVDAVSCAIRIQQGLDKNSILSLRSGIHIGDITHEGDDIFGDGVNVAARLEALAVPGGIAVSDAVYGSLDGTLSPAFDDAGEKCLKNIPRAIRVWTRTAQPSGERPHSLPRTREQREGFPVIVCIQPISTVDKRPEVRDLAAGLTSDLSSYLGNGRWLDALIREDPPDGAFVLSASLRASGERLRLDASLLGRNREQIWSRRVDGNLTDAFDWQDQAGPEVATGALATIYESEKARVTEPAGADDTSAGWLLRAVLHPHTTRETAAITLTAIERAIEKDPNWALPYAWGCHAIRFVIASGFGDQFGRYGELLEEWQSSGNACPRGDPVADLYLDYSSFWEEPSLDRMMRTVNEVIKRHPFHFVALYLGSQASNYRGDPLTGINFARKLLDFVADPQFVPVARVQIGISLIQLGRYDEAIEIIELAVADRRDAPVYLRSLASAYANAGRLEEASAIVTRLLRIAPDHSVQMIKNGFPWADTEGISRYFAGLRLAGIPEATE